MEALGEYSWRTVTQKPRPNRAHDNCYNLKKIDAPRSRTRDRLPDELRDQLDAAAALCCRHFVNRVRKGCAKATAAPVGSDGLVAKFGILCTRFHTKRTRWSEARATPSSAWKLESCCQL